MFKNYFKVAVRHLLKNKIYAVINIAGLALGIAACLLLVQYVSFESSYDRFHQNKDRIYRASMFKYEKGEPEQTFAFTYPAVAPNLKKDFPEVEEAVRMRRTRFVVNYEDKVHSELVYFVDEPFLDMFSFSFLKGDPATALEGAYSIVISEDMAQKYFGADDPMGKTLQFDAGQTQIPFTVSGLMKNVPENSHMDFDFLLPYQTYSDYVGQFGADAENSWRWSDFYTYIMLKPGTDVADLQAKLPAFASNYMQETFDRFGYEIAFKLQPLNDIHLYSDLSYELRVNGNIKYVYALGFIALFILLIAWINYINLSTARSMDRAREVGVRKVSGATRRQLISQFLIETVLINALALGGGILLFNLSLPYFQDILGKEITPSILHLPAFWLAALLVFGLGTLLSGLYPSFILSAFRPVFALKNTWQIGRLSTGSAGLRRGLVVFQFVASVGLIAGTLALYRQIQFMQKQDLGINIDQTLVVRDNQRHDSTFVERVKTFRQTLLSHPDIVNFTASGDIPGKEVGNSWNLRRVKDENESLKRCRTFAIDADFIPNYELEIIAGRNFSEDYGMDENLAILNETAVKVLGFTNPEAALNEEITSTDGEVRMRVIGVIKDYHQESLKYNFKPIVYRYAQVGWNYYSLQVQTNNPQEVLYHVEKSWKTHFADAPIQHFFLDDFFNRQYQADMRFGWIVGLFSVLAIIVACLGLFGLASFSISRRTKEIGVRKILGAQVGQILLLLFREFFRLILIASLVALPIAFWLISRWLGNYAYAISLSWWFFVLPVLAVVLIAALTVGFHSVRAATANPVNSLRYE